MSLNPKAFARLRDKENKAKQTVEQRRQQERIEYEKQLKKDKKSLLVNQFADHQKEEMNTVELDTESMAKYKKELNDSIQRTEKLRKKRNNLMEELIKSVSSSEEQEKSIFLQSFFGQNEQSTLRNNDSMNFKGTSMSRFQKTMNSGYLTKSQENNVEQIHVQIENLKENYTRVQDMIEVQADTKDGLNQKIKDIRFSINKVQKELNELKQVREVTDRRFADLETRQMNAVKKQKHINDQLYQYRRQIQQIRDKEREYIFDIQSNYQLSATETKELQDEIAGYMTQIELRTNDIYKQQNEIQSLDNTYNDIQQKLYNSHIIQDYLEVFEIIHKSFIKDFVGKIGQDIYTADLTFITEKLLQFMIDDKMQSQGASAIATQIENKALKSQNGSQQKLKLSESNISSSKNLKTEQQLQEEEKQYDRSGMVKYLQSFYDEYESPDFVVEDLVQKFKEFSILHESLYSRYEELIHLKKLKKGDIENYQSKINDIVGNESQLKDLQKFKIGQEIKRHDSQQYPLETFQNLKKNPEKEKPDLEKVDEAQQQEQQEEKQNTQQEEEDEEDVDYETLMDEYENRHNLSKMKLKYQDETIGKNVKLYDHVSKTQSFSFKLFFGLIETLFRYSVALKLVLENQVIEDQELTDFYNEFKQFIATFRLGLSPKRELNVSYVKVQSDDVKLSKEDREAIEKIKRQQSNKPPGRNLEKRQSQIIFDGLQFQHSSHEKDGDKTPHQKRESAFMRDQQEDKSSLQETQIEKFLEISNFIPLESSEIQNIFIKVFPDRDQEAKDFGKLVKHDLIIQFMISKQVLENFLLKIKEDIEEQHSDNHNYDELMNMTLTKVFDDFQILKSEAMVQYHKILENVFDYYGKFTKMMQEKFQEVWEECSEDVRRWFSTLKQKSLTKNSKQQMEFNRKIIDKLVEERKNPDFDRLEYPVTNKKEHRIENDEESGKPKTEDWKKIIYKMADETKKHKISDSYNKKEEEQINIYDKQTLEQRRIMQMDDNEYMEHERKAIKNKLNGQNNHHHHTHFHHLESNQKKMSKTDSKNFYSQQRNESKEFLKHFLEHEKVIWSLRTLELQHKQFDSKNSKLKLDDYIPKKYNAAINDTLMNSQLKSKTQSSLRKEDMIHQKDNFFPHSKSQASFKQYSTTSQSRFANKNKKLNPIKEDRVSSFQKKKQNSKSVPKKKLNKKPIMSQQLPKLDKIHQELYQPALQSQNYELSQNYYQGGPYTNKNPGSNTSNSYVSPYQPEPKYSSILVKQYQNEGKQ